MWREEKQNTVAYRESIRVVWENLIRRLSFSWISYADSETNLLCCDIA